MQPDTVLGVFNFAVDAPSWIEERTQVRAVLQALAATSLGKLIRNAGTYEEMAPVSSTEELCARIATGESETFALNAGEDGGDMTIQLSIAPLALELTASCYGEELRARKATILDDMVELARAVAGTGLHLCHGYVAPVEEDQALHVYPRPRPPRSHVTIEPGAIVDLVEPDFEQENDPEATETARAMAECPLPPFARRARDGRFVEIRWAQNVTDLPELDRGCAAHEEWLASVAPTEIDGDYNELGDEAEPMRGLEARDGVTRYDPRGKIAYVAVVILPDGEPEETYWAAALELVKRRATSDGSPVDKVRIIAPLRRLALGFTARAKQHGIDAVLYPGEGGHWWNPDPPGDWAYPPRP